MSMGLFCSPVKDDAKSNIEAAIRNIKLFLEHENLPESNYSYLLDGFALGQLEIALVKLKDKHN
jgi:hypothetical protein